MGGRKTDSPINLVLASDRISRKVNLCEINSTLITISLLLEALTTEKNVYY